MQESRTEDDLQTGTIDESAYDINVLVLVGGKEREIPCSYEHCKILFSGDTPAPTFFNLSTTFNQYPHDFCVYMSQDFNFVDENSLENLVNAIEDTDATDVGAFYTDVKVAWQGFYHRKYNPAYNSNFYKNKEIFNIPYIVKTAILPVFDEGIQHVYLWDGFLWLMKKTLMYHIPQETFLSEDNSPKFDIKAEMDLINGTHF